MLTFILLWSKLVSCSAISWVGGLIKMVLRNIWTTLFLTYNSLAKIHRKHYQYNITHPSDHRYISHIISSTTSIIILIHFPIVTIFVPYIIINFIPTVISTLFVLVYFITYPFHYPYVAVLFLFFFHSTAFYSFMLHRQLCIQWLACILAILNIINIILHHSDQHCISLLRFIYACMHYVHLVFFLFCFPCVLYNVLPFTNRFVFQKLPSL